MLSEYFERNKDKIDEALKNSKYPETAKVLDSFYKKSKSINEALQRVDFESNFYPCIILSRCMIEHYIVATYIWIQFRINENDEIAKIYRNDYLVYEISKRINYSKANGIELSSRIAKMFMKILEILTKTKVIKQKDFEKLNIRANQFDIRKISRFLDNNLPLEYDNIIKASTIKRSLEYYNYFSTFVHGGPTADALMADEYRGEFQNQAKELIGINAAFVVIQRFYILYFLGMSNDEFVDDLNTEILAFVD